MVSHDCARRRPAAAPFLGDQSGFAVWLSAELRWIRRCWRSDVISPSLSCTLDSATHLSKSDVEKGREKGQRDVFKKKDRGRTRKRKQDGNVEIHWIVCVGFFFSPYAYYVAATNSVSLFTQKGFLPGTEITQHSLQSRQQVGGKHQSAHEWGHAHPSAYWGFPLEPPGQEVERGCFGFTSKVRLKGVGGGCLGSGLECTSSSWWSTSYCWVPSGIFRIPVITSCHSPPLVKEESCKGEENTS